ncbi:MAG: 4-hydroxybutyrate--acetyl-CoA CoA transferase, partial [Spirochaetaceae bacterium]
MKNWNEDYKRRLISMEEAVGHIKTGDDIIVGQCASEPQGLMSRIHTVRDRVEDVRVFSVLTLQPYDFYMRRDMEGHFELASWFHAPGSRKALKEGLNTVTYVPNMLHRAAMDRIQAKMPNIFFGTCTPPDSKGFV